MGGLGVWICEFRYPRWANLRACYKIPDHPRVDKPALRDRGGTIRRRDDTEARRALRRHAGLQILELGENNSKIFIARCELTPTSLSARRDESQARDTTLRASSTDIPTIEKMTNPERIVRLDLESRCRAGHAQTDAPDASH